MDDFSFITIARITKPQGLKGEVRVSVNLEDDRVFESGRRVQIVMKSAKRQTEIEYFRRQHGRAVIKLRGVESISDAEKVVGAELRIPAADLAPLEEGRFYTFDLKGCTVFSVGDEYLGIVTDVLDSGGTEILKVDLHERELLIPFAQAYVKNVDLSRKRIDVELPDGLREMNA